MQDGPVRAAESEEQFSAILHLAVPDMVEQAFNHCNVDPDTRAVIIRDAEVAIATGRGHEWKVLIADAHGTVHIFTLDHHHARETEWHIDFNTWHVHADFIWIRIS